LQSPRRKAVRSVARDQEQTKYTRAKVVKAQKGRCSLCEASTADSRSAGGTSTLRACPLRLVHSAFEDLPCLRKDEEPFDTAHQVRTISVKGGEDHVPWRQCRAV
jgi:hypothetical protein